MAAYPKAHYSPEKWEALEAYDEAERLWRRHTGRYLCQSRAGAEPGGLGHGNDAEARAECVELHDACNAARAEVAAL